MILYSVCPLKYKDVRILRGYGYPGAVNVFHIQLKNGNYNVTSISYRKHRKLHIGQFLIVWLLNPRDALPSNAIAVAENRQARIVPDNTSIIFVAPALPAPATLPAWTQVLRIRLEQES